MSEMFEKIRVAIRDGLQAEMEKGTDEEKVGRLLTFEEAARQVCAALNIISYSIAEPPQGWPTVEQLRAASTEEQWVRLMDHALAFACLDGNAFPDLVEQYVPEAWTNLMQNGWADGERFPKLAGYSA